MYDSDAAWRWVTEYTASASLRHHMRAVSVAMAHYARHFDEDEELWATVGLLHDFDYEQHPDVGVDGHPVVGARLLREAGWPEPIVRAILSHAEEITGVAPESRLERCLLAVDELTGLITAVALVRPSRDIRDVRLKSIRKKWKDRRFAAGVDRAEIERATERLGVPLDEHIGHVLAAMQAAAHELGLAGEDGG